MNKTEIAEYFQHNILERENRETKGIEELNLSFIDSGISDIVKMLNVKYNIDTFSSCSGILSEHYNIEKIKQNVPYRELKNNYGCPPNGYMLMKRPILSTESFMHSGFKTDQVTVESEFYSVLKPNIIRVKVPDPVKRISWKVSVGDEANFNNPEFVGYFFQLTLPTRRRIVNMTDSYEQYDSFIKKCIVILQNALEKSL